MPVCLYAPVCACTGRSRLIFDISTLYPLLFYPILWGRISQDNLEFPDIANLTYQLALGIPCLPLEDWVMGGPPLPLSTRHLYEFHGVQSQTLVLTMLLSSCPSALALMVGCSVLTISVTWKLLVSVMPGSTQGSITSAGLDVGVHVLPFNIASRVQDIRSRKKLLSILRTTSAHVQSHQIKITWEIGKGRFLSSKDITDAVEKGHLHRERMWSPENLHSSQELDKKYLPVLEELSRLGRNSWVG